MRPDFWPALRSPIPWALLALAATMPFLLPNYYLHILTITLVYAALASAWNIVGGIAGQISLAHSLFVGAGAMLASALLVKLGINMWLGMVIAAAASAAMGAAVSFIDYRFRLGHLSFALITMAFAEMAEIYVTNTEFLGGASGLFLPKDKGDLLAFQFGGISGVYWIMLGIETAQIALHYGADDIDGTVRHELIYHDAGAKTPEFLSVQRIRQLIEETGRIPVERDTLYRKIQRDETDFRNWSVGEPVAVAS